MTYIAKAAVCSQICTKHTRQSDHHVEFFNFNPYPANVENMMSSE
jgi:hypothetical protein